MSERAGWWPRAGAMLIDALILTAIALAVGITMSSAGASGDESTVAIYIVVFLASLIYSPLMMARAGDANGQTVGKQALGIRVVHSEGGDMTLPRGLLRDAVGKAVLGIIPFYTFVDILVPLFDSGNQALHDKVGKTYVVPAATQAHGTGTSAPADTTAPHPAWSAPPAAPRDGAPLPPTHDHVPPPPPPPPPSLKKQPALPDSPSEEQPDLGGFAPPSAPRPGQQREDDGQRGPYGPTHD